MRRVKDVTLRPPLDVATGREVLDGALVRPEVALEHEADRIGGQRDLPG